MYMFIPIYINPSLFAFTFILHYLWSKKKNEILGRLCYTRKD